MSALAKRSIAQLLEEIATKSPTPGGGAVAAVTGALAASLGAMVVQYSLGRKSLAEYADTNESALKSLKTISEHLLPIADADADAYGRLNALWKLDKADPKRVAKWDAAVDAAIDAPKRIVLASLDILRLLEGLIETSNRMLISDLAIAAILADAAARAGAWNVSINLPQVSDQSKTKAIRSETDILLRECAELARKIEAAARAHAES